jgi:cyclic pyranopterin phosphate synthase
VELTDGELLRLIKAFGILGIDKVRFTGGEPLLRLGITGLVERTAALEKISLVALTTNGLILEPILPSLIDAGLNRLNISLDTLDRKTYRMITGTDGLERVRQSIESAEKSGAFPWVKVNTVVMRGINDGEIEVFAEWALKRKIDLRLIEYMPAKNSGWGRELYVSESEIRQKAGIQLEEEKTDLERGGPARRYRYRDYPGRISFISAVSRSFCNSCNRLRLTSNGELVGCLFRKDKADLTKLLRKETSDEEIASHIMELAVKSWFRRTPASISTSDYKPSMRNIGG